MEIGKERIFVVLVTLLVTSILLFNNDGSWRSTFGYLVAMSLMFFLAGNDRIRRCPVSLGQLTRRIFLRDKRS